MRRGNRISTLTFETNEDEPIFGLRPGCDRFPIPKDAQDFLLLPQEGILLGRNGTTLNAEGRLELRKLDAWEPVPYAVLPFVPPFVADGSLGRALVHLPLIEGFESGMAVIDLNHFKEICRLPFTGPFDFIPPGADCYSDEESQIHPAPWSDPEVTVGESNIQTVRSISVDPRSETTQHLLLPQIKTGIIATMPHDIADEELIADQPYSELVRGRPSRGRRGHSCRSPVIIDYKTNVVHRVQRETEGADHILVPDAQSMFVVTEDNVYLRRIDLTSGAIDWDLEFGQNEKGTVFTSYATAYGETHLGRFNAVGIYDERVDIIDADSGECVSQIWLHEEGRSRIVSLVWYPGGGMLAIGLVTGTILFAWLPENLDNAWRMRVFRGADRSLRRIRFNTLADRLFTLSQDGFLRAWALLDDEQARMLPA